MEKAINILVMEDNPADVKLLDIYLREGFESNYRLTVADTLSDGLAKLANSVFDLLIVDLTLPDSVGLDTFHSIYDQSSGTPIIVLTGLEDELLGINAVKSGAQDFLIKGKVNSKSLIRSIKHSIERNKLHIALAESAKRLEEKTNELLREKEKLAEAQRIAQCGSWEWDMEKNKVECSDELFRIAGLLPYEIQPSYENFIKLLHFEDRDYVKKIIENSIEHHFPFSCYFRIVRFDGSVRILFVTSKIQSGNEGEIVKITGTAQDVTDRKREEELEKLSLVASKSYNAVLITNKEGKIEWINDGFTRLSGYRLEDVMGTSGEILTGGEETGLSPKSPHYDTIYKEKKPVSYECKNYTKSGKEYWVLTSITPILNENGELDKFIIIDSDISKQKKAEQDLILANMIAELSLYKGNKALEELNNAKIQLEESLKVKERFLANMSHEIRTPMNAIIGFTKLLMKAELLPEYKQYVNAIKTSGDNLLVIINDILDFSKLESGKMVFDSVDFNLPQLNSALVELVISKAIEKGIKLISHIDSNVPEWLVGDPTRLNQILVNLLSNAIKFTNKGEVALNIALLNENEKSVELEFSIRDSGIGISPESLSKIFESFMQASNSTTRKFGGTGLGLSITRHLVEMQGGTINVESKVNEGSCFKVCIRYKKSIEKDAQQIKDKSLAELDALTDKSMKGVNILLVEDNILNQILAKKVLLNWNCTVDTADTGVVAVEKIKNNHYDLILMDIQLPEMDGYEATKIIRSQLSYPKCNIPIIAMTAHAIIGEAEKCIQIGMDDYISKPFDENVLHEKIKHILSEIKIDHS